MTKKELEIKCKVLEERLQKINEICNAHTFGKDNEARTIGRILYYSDENDTKMSIEHKINMNK